MFIERVNRRSKAVKKCPLNGSIEEVRAIKECPQNGSINKGDGKISYWVSLGIRIHSRVRRVDVEQCHTLFVTLDACCVHPGLYWIVITPLT